MALAAVNALLRDRPDELFCWMSDNYYAMNIADAEGKLLHEITGIPLVAVLHDHPLHFLVQQIPKLQGTIAFVPGEDSKSFIAAHYPAGREAVVNHGSLPPMPAETPDFEQFMGRNNAILAPLNLNFGTVTLDVAWEQIKSLPAARRDVATALAEAALTDVTTPLHELAASASKGLSPEDAVAAVSDQLLVLTFVKLWSRNQMIRALIDLPILVSSSYVPGDLQFKYPKKFTLLTMADTLPLYREYRFTLNAHPLLTGLVHDRLLMANALNSAVITDANVAVKRWFQDGVDAIFFDYDKIAEMPQRVQAYLDDPARAYELTVQAAALREASDTFGYREGYEALIDAVAARWPAESRVNAKSAVLV